MTTMNQKPGVPFYAVTNAALEALNTSSRMCLFDLYLHECFGGGCVMEACGLIAEFRILKIEQREQKFHFKAIVTRCENLFLLNDLIVVGTAVFVSGFDCYEFFLSVEG